MLEPKIVSVFDEDNYRACLAAEPLFGEHRGNVWAFSYYLPHSGAKITLSRTLPGDTHPHFTVTTVQGLTAEVEVSDPGRFGTYGTIAEFREWCRKYKSS